MNTRITKLLEIKIPILQGPMAFISDCHLAAAVSNAGGAGILGAAGRDPAWVEEQIDRTRRLTDRPFGISIPAGLRQEYGDLADQIVDIICRKKVKFVTLGAGNPIPLIPKFHDHGILVGGIVPNTRLAKRVEGAGADFLIIEGTEAGGRIGRQTTLALMTNVIPQISIPVLAAGGFVDGRGLAAARLMGAEGVQIGTRFLVAEECRVHEDYKNGIIAAHDEDNISLGLTRNLGMRGLKSPYTEKYLQLELEGVSNETLYEYSAGMSKRIAEKGLGEDGMNGMIQCGQSLEALSKVQPAKEILEEIVSEAEAVLKQASTLV